MQEDLQNRWEAMQDSQDMRKQRKKQKAPKKKYTKRQITDSLQIYALMSPVLLLILIFSYFPMYGVIIAFQDYVPGKPFFGQDVVWVGLRWFKRFVTGHYFFRLARNTIRLWLYGWIGFCAPIAFAILLEQFRHMRFKKTVQTVSYLPHFISSVIIVGMVINFVSEKGFVTQFLTLFGLPEQNYRMSKAAFPWVYTMTGIWSGFGWGSILYCSVISSIDPNLYEAARIDGAHRGQLIWHITLPSLKSIIAIQLIMSMSGFLGANSDFILLYYTPAIYDVADVFGTYNYRSGILGGEYSYTSAVGLFMSAIGCLMTITVNKISDKLTGYSLF